MKNKYQNSIFIEALTLMLIYLKLTNQINWNWFYVLFPITFSIVILCVAFVFFFLVKALKRNI